MSGKHYVMTRNNSFERRGGVVRLEYSCIKVLFPSHGANYKSSQTKFKSIIRQTVIELLLGNYPDSENKE